MNKATLINFVADQERVNKKDAKAMIESILAGIVDGLATDGKVTLVGFGTFQLTAKDARVARNPKTGEPVNVPAKVVPKFRPSAGLKAQFVALTEVPTGAPVVAAEADEADEAAE